MNIGLVIKENIKQALSWLGIFVTQNQRYDYETYQTMKRLLKKTSNCVDVGCHKGEVLLDMMKLAPEGKHVGFEPLPNLYKELRMNFNGRCDIYPFALSDSAGNIDFKYVVSDPAYSGMKERSYRDDNTEVQTITVQSRTMDEVLFNVKDRIDLIKIDVEGAEMQVLNGAIKILKHWRPIIIFEHGKGASDFYGTKPEDLYALLVDECKLKITLLTRFLKNQVPLTLEEFKEQYEKNLNYYFLAY